MDQNTSSVAASSVDSATQPQAGVPAAPDLRSAPADADQARGMLDRLRLQRVAGQVTEQDYLQRSDYLLRLASGENVAAPVDRYSPEAQAQQAQQQDDEWMSAPSGLQGYTNLPSMSSDEGDAMELDMEARKALSAGGVPVHLAGPLMENLVRAQTMANADQATVRTKLSTTESYLREQWGEGFQSRVNAIADVVYDMAEASPVLAAIIDHFPEVFAIDKASMDYLDRVAQQRQRKARR